MHMVAFFRGQMEVSFRDFAA